MSLIKNINTIPAVKVAGGLPSYSYHSDPALFMALGSDLEAYFEKDGAERISAWYDERGSGQSNYAEQQTPSAQPLYTASGVSVTSGDYMDMINNFSIGSGAGSFIIVGEHLSADNFNYLDAVNGDYFRSRSSNSARLRVNGINYALAINAGSFYSIIIRFTGTGVIRSKVDGGAWANLVASGAGAFGAVDDLFVNATTPYVIKGLVMFDGDVSEGNLSSYQTELNDRYATY